MQKDRVYYRSDCDEGYTLTMWPNWGW